MRVVLRNLFTDPLVASLVVDVEYDGIICIHHAVSRFVGWWTETTIRLLMC